MAFDKVGIHTVFAQKPPPVLKNLPQKRLTNDPQIDQIDWTSSASCNLVDYGNFGFNRQRLSDINRDIDITLAPLLSHCQRESPS